MENNVGTDPIRPVFSFCDEMEETASWTGDIPEIDLTEAVQDIQADVVVIGAGLAGISAARAAAERGAETVLIEKTEKPQGRGRDFAVIGGALQERLGRNDISIDEVIDCLMDQSLYHAKRQIIKRWAEECADAFDWYISSCPELYIADQTRADIPDEYKDLFLVPARYPIPEEYDYRSEKHPVYPVTFTFPAGQGRLLPFHLQRGLETGHLTVMFSTTAVRLIQDQDGQVTGVYARGEQGGLIRFDAGSGVVLATGDYANDPKMLKHLNPALAARKIGTIWTGFDSRNIPTNTGDGIKMGIWAGADVQWDPAPMLPNIGSVMGNGAFLLLNKKGERFCNEECLGDELENQIEMQPEMVCYQLFDSKWKEQLAYMPAAHGTKCYYSDDIPFNNPVSKNHVSEDDLQTALASGRAFSADTIDGLLDLLDIDKEKSLKSGERYSVLAEQGRDEDFNKSAKRMFPLKNPPFYAVPMRNSLILVVLGGLVSDEECRVYDRKGDCIPHLYVAGNTQGNRFALQYPGNLPGISHSMALTYGRIAGENAAGKRK